MKSTDRGGYMAKYEVKLIMSDTYIVEAESEEEAEQKARKRFDIDYLNDEERYFDLIDKVEIKSL